MNHSRDSVRRLEKLFLGLRKPELCFHQTLTFSPPELDVCKAKKALNRLLDNLCGQFPGMAVVYAAERQRNGGVHYHALLFFFDETDFPFARPAMLPRLRAEFFRAWNDLNGGRLARAANLMKTSNPNVNYLTKPAHPNGAKIERWWGKRNGALLARNSGTPSKPAIRAKMSEKHPRVPLPLGLRTDAREIARLKANILEVDFGGNAWEEFKRSETGERNAVSDAEYLEFRKRKAREWLARNNVVWR
jgi:hypothetical protein